MSSAALQRAGAPTTDSQVVADIGRLGFSTTPIPFLSPEECAAFERHLGRPDRPLPLDWAKGHAVVDKVVCDIGSDPRLIGLLRSLLGDDIVLWGASTVRKEPGQNHSWHTDIESADPECRIVSVWIAIRNAGENSGLRFIAGSHRFGCSVQETLAGLGIDREAVTDHQMAEIARAKDADASIVHPTARDGEALLFDGRVWHASRNDGARGPRTALLLQYASADTPIPMPDGTSYAWPFRFSKGKRVPAILVSGSDRHSANRLVPTPLPLPDIITTLTRSVALPLAEEPVERWRAYPQFRGPTRTLADMSCHISVLSAGHHPHPPHIHPEEEVLIVIDGTVEIELAEDNKGRGGSRHALRPGMFSYYPATQHHTIHCVGPGPATYLMFKWHAGKADVPSPLQTSIFEYDATPRVRPEPMVHKLLFERATDCLGKLHAHLTVLQPGGGYEPHADPYDVAIILLSGEVETVGERVRPLGIIYYSAGELHGMRNVGVTPATYLVFEFHGPVALKRQSTDARHLRQVEHLKQQVERQRIKLDKLHRKLEKERRKRGLRGSIRSLVKAVRKLLR